MLWRSGPGSRTRTHRAWPLIIAIALGALSGCKPTPYDERSDMAIAADRIFWDALHRGQFERVSEVENALVAALMLDHRDGPAAVHMGFLNAWVVTESARIAQPARKLRAGRAAMVAARAFKAGLAFYPSDARLYGLLGSMEVGIANAVGSDSLHEKAVAHLKEGVRIWPEFNHFVYGIALSGEPHDSARFQSALNAQFDNIRVCYGDRIRNGKIEDLKGFLEWERESRKTRRMEICWNNWVAPHNFDGFLLNLGDMLVKAGRVDEARNVYRTLKDLPSFRDWPYADRVDPRIENAPKNVAVFRMTEGELDRAAVNPQERFYLESSLTCMACHQAGAAEYRAWTPEKTRHLYTGPAGGLVK